MNKETKKNNSKKQVNNAELQHQSHYNASRDNFFRGDTEYVYKRQDTKNGPWTLESVDITKIKNGRQIAIMFDEDDCRHDREQDTDERYRCKVADRKLNDEDGEADDREPIDICCAGDSLGEEHLMKYNPETILFKEPDKRLEMLGEMLRKFMEQLKPDEAEVLFQYYWEGISQKKIGDSMPNKRGGTMTEAGISKKRTGALEKLREMFEKAGITEFRPK